MISNDKSKLINQETNKNVALVFVILIVVFIISFPLFMEHFILKNNIYSILSNEDWSAFLGSFIGGSIGGIGTMLAVYITTQDTKINVSTERKLRRYAEQKVFIDEIARNVSEFSTDMFNFALAISRYKAVEKNRNDKFEYEKLLQKKVNELITAQLGKSSAITQMSLDENRNKLEETRREVKILNEKLEDKLKDIKRNVASNNYFLLKVKLKENEGATDLLILLEDIYENTATKSEIEMNWINKKIIELQDCTHNYMFSELQKYKV